jgi:hypothetical protein
MGVAEKLLLRFRHFRLPWRSLGVEMGFIFTDNCKDGGPILIATSHVTINGTINLIAL